MPKRQKVEVREIAPDSFAVVVDGQIVREGFRHKQIGFMWATRRGLYKSPHRRRRDPAEIPNDLIDDRIIGLPLAARLSNVPYPAFLPRARAGEFGPLIQLNSRHYGLRFRDWKAAMTSREVVK